MKKLEFFIDTDRQKSCLEVFWSTEKGQKQKIRDLEEYLKAALMQSVSNYTEQRCKIPWGEGGWGLFLHLSF
jgi:hypothetical protein